ncbi:hypothetical protein SADUNF_Sadunf18G0047200 [Salix dunnii]|uniref:Vesicle transport v-SNARE N-terminal domain-containing protein n=1 Tax=Salix dunnii TaxID=1413687 RepID=A0A835J7T2_9ROSI|nr:hypothetical protein SADUNF_Sadunf18G0047200 [Salix dunnii]
MSEIFVGYECQYCKISSNLFRKCTAAVSLDGEKKKEEANFRRTARDEFLEAGMTAALKTLGDQRSRLMMATEMFCSLEKKKIDRRD